MPELIDKAAAYNALKHEAETHVLSFSAEAYDRAARIIDQMPTIEAEPVRHGRWTLKMLNIGGDDKIRMLQCSECSRYANMKFDFCPNCGARMDAGDDQSGGAENAVT